ncbi:hypothetical protein RvY_02862 [Ramazzottius varieornatus]|uniref:RRM domain-containing protein n=1 Tax=Ramazzottius varieornatus TaxID=947166 RepID=A0A1D1UWB3_RAMVA|nr:hypothetical protein RvY_02862 [Ramazzottius varieornatus]
MRGTKLPNEENITSNPLQAKRPPSRDFAIRGVPKHVTTEQLKNNLQSIGIIPHFLRIVCVGPDAPKPSTVGRIEFFASDLDIVLKTENRPSNIRITPLNFGL